MNLSHTERQALTAQMRERAIKVAATVEGLSVNSNANVHILADGAALVECVLFLAAEKVEDVVV